MTKKLKLKNRKNQTIVGELTIPQTDIKGVCIVEHGYSGFKEQSHIIKMAQAFAENGFITFNFDATNSFNESDGEFEKATMQLHYEDLVDVIDWAQKQDWFEGKLALTGHSMGGYAVARYAEEHSEQVSLVAPIAPAISGKLSWEAHKKYYPGQLEEWKESGWLITESKSKPGVTKRSPWSHMEERLNHDLLPKASNITMPIFLYAGGEDTACPVDQIKLFYDKIPSINKKMIINPEARHTYRTEQEIEHLYNSVDEWIKQVNLEEK